MPAQAMPVDMELPLEEMLRDFATRMPGKRAFVFLGEDNAEEEVLTYGELDRRARKLAALLGETAEPGDRVLLIFPTCLSFVVAFFACLYAGMIAVPMVTPRSRRLRDAAISIALDCEPKVALTTAAYLVPARQQFEDAAQLKPIRFLVVDEIDEAPAPVFVPAARTVEAAQALDPLAFLQYTSGSTSAPKGVMVGRRNLLANLAMMKAAFENDADATYVGWAPLFHDMGLIANVLEPFYIGALCVLMAPAAFAQKPWLWLRAISHYRARVSGGPNFAYDLCIDRSARVLQESLDLSCWRIAFNSAEPVRAGTIDRFSQLFAPVGFAPQAFFPCYGMAEGTLLLTGGPAWRMPAVRDISKAQLSLDHARPCTDSADRMAVVGCGHTLIREDVRIVDARTQVQLADGEVGEIWASGPHIPRGYWGKPKVSEDTFHAVLGEAPGREFLRTGDLGFLDAGELYIVGRIKDVIIARGRNFYPQDIERAAEKACPGLMPGASAAFTAARLDAQEVVLVQEVERSARHSIKPWQAVAAIRKAVFEEFELTLNRVILIQPGSIPKTSSGKIKRAETRQRYLAGTLEPITERPQAAQALPAQAALVQEEGEQE